MATDPGVITSPPPAAVPATQSATPDTGGNADVSSSATVTERGWDGWPTPPTPEYLVPGMGKVPVSSTAHFQTVAMTSMGDEVPARQLRELGRALVRMAQMRRDRQWALDAAGSVTITTVPVAAAPAEPADGSIDTMVESLRTGTLPWRSWSEHWRDQAFANDRETYQEALREIEARERALEQGESKEAQVALRRAQRALVVTMWQRVNEIQTDLARVSAIESLLPVLLRAPLLNWMDVVTRLEAAGLTGRDIYVGDEPGMTSVQDALNGMFSFFDEGRLDPLAYAEPDAMDSPAEGVLLHQEQGWFARGLALGNLLHSVALAPGEVTQIAMTHWNHSTRSSDSETVSQQDSTAESDLQDRAVTEVQQAATREHAGGGSLATSLGASAQGGYSGFGVSVSGGLSTNLSTAVTFSDGSKNLSMESNQRVAAVTQRHAEAARTRRATVVREVSQNEAQDLTTRVLANYNHMHAMTVMYFEVIEVFDLKTRVVDAERLIFLPFKLRDVKHLIPRFRAVLIDAARAAGKPELAEAIEHFHEELDQLEALDARIAELDGIAADAVPAAAPAPARRAAAAGPGKRAERADAAPERPEAPTAFKGEIARTEDSLATIKTAIRDLSDSFVKPRSKLESEIDVLTAKSSATMAAYKDTPAYLGAAASQAVQSIWQGLDAQVRQLRSQIDAMATAEARALEQLQEARGRRTVAGRAPGPLEATEGRPPDRAEPARPRPQGPLARPPAVLQPGRLAQPVAGRGAGARATPLHVPRRAAVRAPRSGARRHQRQLRRLPLALRRCGQVAPVPPALRRALCRRPGPRAGDRQDDPRRADGRRVRRGRAGPGGVGRKDRPVALLELEGLDDPDPADQHQPADGDHGDGTEPQRRARQT